MFYGTPRTHTPHTQTHAHTHIQHLFVSPNIFHLRLAGNPSFFYFIYDFEILVYFLFYFYRMILIHRIFNLFLFNFQFSIVNF